MGNAPPQPVHDGPAVRFERRNDSKDLLIAFTSMHGAGFDFTNVARGLPVNKLFLRDVYLCWYQCGIREVSENVDQTAEYIARLIGDGAFRRVVLAGVSGGGYAALLFGWLLSADEVHAVSPRCYLDWRNRVRYLDFRLLEHLRTLYGSGRAQPEYFDLRAVFASADPGATDFHIYFSENSRVDRAHAAHMEGLPGIVLHPFDEGGHLLGIRLARDGVLERTLARALAVALPDDREA